MVRHSQTRRGVTLVECALIYPLTLMLILAILIGGLGLFRYQEVASLAREGARYASVKGAKYAQVTGNAAATQDDVYNNAIQPRLIMLDPSQLNCTQSGVNWVTWPDGDNKQGSRIQVTVSYTWVPEAYLGGITLSSTSTMTISY
jgi:Flp pilus assembly protein TadG